MAKFGQLVLDSGMWKGKQLVNKDWIKEMTTIRVNDMYSKQFGYLWWKDENRKMTYMHGHGGQFVGIIPGKKLIVVFTAEVNTQDQFQLGIEAFEWVDKIGEKSVVYLLEELFNSTQDGRYIPAKGLKEKIK
jgi:CubicO group peptidase (beta-lactamase class C family)